jgi:hypothetical protein
MHEVSMYLTIRLFNRHNGHFNPLAKLILASRKSCWELEAPDRQYFFDTWLLVRQKNSYFFTANRADFSEFVLQIPECRRMLELNLVLLDCQLEPLTATGLHLFKRIGEKHLCDAWRPLG